MLSTNIVSLGTRLGAGDLQIIMRMSKIRDQTLG